MVEESVLTTDQQLSRIFSKIIEHIKEDLNGEHYLCNLTTYMNEYNYEDIIRKHLIANKPTKDKFVDIFNCESFADQFNWWAYGDSSSNVVVNEQKILYLELLIEQFNN